MSDQPTALHPSRRPLSSSLGSPPRRRAIGPRLRNFRAGLRAALLDDRGSATAEYAIATMAAVGFAGLLVALLRGDEVRGLLTQIIHTALTSGI